MREDSFKALVGSHNYNLNHKDSDRDYKVFFYPSFDDLYSGEKYSKAKTTESEDVEYHDIRKLPDMLWKSNVNFIEVLFSQEVTGYDGLYECLYNRREEIARMNLPYLYDACMGMFLKKKKEFERDWTKGETIRSYKDVMAATRIIDFLERYASNGWNFEKAIWYGNDEFNYNLLLNVRQGKYQTEDELRVFIDGVEKLLAALKKVYKSQKEDNETNEWVREVIELAVRKQIYEELK